MKHRVAELDGALLDAAVATAMGLRFRMNGACFANPEDDPDEPQDLMSTFEPSSYWDHGGPIIERERIMLFSWCRDGEFVYDENGNNPRLIVPARWAALHAKDYDAFGESCVEVTHRQGSVGPTPLIAAMRAYVASKFGEEIDL